MNELATISRSEQLELAATLGMGGTDGPSGTDRLPELKINYQEENEQGQELPRGQLYVKGTGEDPIFAKTVTFRPLSQLFQWIEYDPEANKVANKTLMIPMLRDEARDMKGTVRCGKPVSKVLNEMSKEDQRKYTNIKCFRQIRGLVSYKGKTADGEEAKIENMPVIIMAKGSGFGTFEDEFLKRIPRRNKMYEFSSKISLSREKGSGGNVWWVMHYEPKLDDALPMTEEIYETCKVMASMVKSENEKVEAAYKKALTDSDATLHAVEAIEGVSTDLEDDLADEE
jgi:hypothetical protein